MIGYHNLALSIFLLVALLLTFFYSAVGLSTYPLKLLVGNFSWIIIYSSCLENSTLCDLICNLTQFLFLYLLPSDCNIFQTSEYNLYLIYCNNFRGLMMVRSCHNYWAKIWIALVAKYILPTCILLVTFLAGSNELILHFSSFPLNWKFVIS